MLYWSKVKTIALNIYSLGSIIDGVDTFHGTFMKWQLGACCARMQENSDFRRKKSNL